ncbi:MAG TPA: hypothetical protein VGN88_03305, partial [Phycisphaerae bacterium]
TRRVTALGLVPAFPKNVGERQRLSDALHVKAAEGHWLIGGYMDPDMTVPEGQSPTGTLLEKWAERSGEGSLTVWNELRYMPGHRYYLFKRDEVRNLIDFGAE